MFGWLIPEGQPGHVPCPDEAMIVGPTKSGKTHTIAEWCKYAVETWPDTKGLVLRKRKNSLVDAWQEVFERILGPTHPLLMTGGNGVNRQRYKAKGYGEIVLGGIDEPLKLYSTNYDWVYWNEMQEGTRDEWESLIRASFGRPSSFPVRVQFGDCNPAHRTHWANMRAKEGGIMHRIKGQLWDSPILFDHELMDWTEEGSTTLGRFGRVYTGPRRDRMLLGLWVTAEGLAWPGWNPDVHIVVGKVVKDAGQWFLDIASWAKEPGGKPVRRRVAFFLGAQDVGFRNPGVAGVWAVDTEGVMFLVEEHYHTGWDRDEWLEAWGGISERYGKALKRVVCDHDPGFIDTMNQKIPHHGKKGQPWFVPADKQRGSGGEMAGLDEVRARMRVRVGGRCGIYFLDGALAHAPDPELVDRQKPWRTVDEIDAYVLAPPPVSSAREVADKEDPVKVNDHGCDQTRYAAAALRNDQWIEKEPVVEYEPRSLGALMRHNEVLGPGRKRRLYKGRTWRNGQLE